MEDIHSIFEIQAEGKGLQLEFTLNEYNAEANDYIVTSDWRRLKQVFVNLISNALKFTN